MTRPSDVTLKPSELPMWGPCSAPKTVDPADELGKVWDVLHAAGINGAGGMSASEGVKALAAKLSSALVNGRDLLDQFINATEGFDEPPTEEELDAYRAAFEVKEP